MKKISEYSPFSHVDMLCLFEDHYPIENEVLLKEIFKNNKTFFEITIDELKDLGFIENGMSYHYHWLTEKGKKYLDENR